MDVTSVSNAASCHGARPASYEIHPFNRDKLRRVRRCCLHRGAVCYSSEIVYLVGPAVVQ